jgi:hypothetical protein
LWVASTIKQQIEARKSMPRSSKKGDELPIREWGEPESCFVMVGPVQPFPSESVMVVLGVLYPSVLPQHVAASTHLDLVLLPPALTVGRQSMDVVFYDPLSSSWNGDEVPLAAKYRRKSKGDGYANRTQAQNAVARDLALLRLGKRE